MSLLLLSLRVCPACSKSASSVSIFISDAALSRPSQRRSLQPGTRLYLAVVAATTNCARAVREGSCEAESYIFIEYPQFLLVPAARFLLSVVLAPLPFTLAHLGEIPLRWTTTKEQATMRRMKKETKKKQKQNSSQTERRFLFFFQAFCVIIHAMDVINLAARCQLASGNRFLILGSREAMPRMGNRIFRCTRDT